MAAAKTNRRLKPHSWAALLALLIFITVAPGHAAFAQSIKSHAPIVSQAVIVRDGERPQLQIIASEPITPQIQILEHPERIVLDFPGAVPGRSLHNMKARSEGVGVRASLLSLHPPTTRIVLDLASPRKCSMQSTGNRLLITLGATSPRTELVALDATPAQLRSGALPASVSSHPPTVSFKNGLLSISAQQADLIDVAAGIESATRIKIDLPDSRKQQVVSVTLGPAPVRQVISQLLDTCKLDFTMAGEGEAIKEVIATIRQTATGPDAKDDAPSAQAGNNPAAASADPHAASFPPVVEGAPVISGAGVVVPIGPDSEVPASKDVPVYESDEDAALSHAAQDPAGAKPASPAH
jgi:hypothetical protein